MNPTNFDIEMLRKMAHSPIKNYVIPGITSSLIGGNPGPGGCMRLFESEREHQESVTPHSHRFDFQCWVIQGKVVNRIWKEASTWSPEADLFEKTQLKFDDMGSYERVTSERCKYNYTDRTYQAGEWYLMRASQIHSINFSRGAVVLFFEGPQEADSSFILEPVVDDELIPTFKVEPWMFKR